MRRVLLPLLGSAAMGGLIGYSTNWLAIKMLFWPLEEKRLFGRRVPFTPGLIPKKRARLAAALGAAVANHLVTPATLEAALAAPEFEHQLQSALFSWWTKLWESGLMPWEGTDDGQDWLDLLSERGGDLLWAALQRTEVRESVIKATGTFGSKLGQLLAGQSGATDQQSERLWHALQSLLEEGDDWQGYLGERLHAVWDDLANQPLGSLLPTELKAGVRATILQRGPDWLDWLQGTLEQPASQRLIKRMLREMLSSSTMFRLFGSFVDLNRVAEQLPQALATVEVRTEISLFLLNGLDALWQTPLAQVVGALFPNGTDQLAVDAWIKQRLTGEQLVGCLRRLCQKGASLLLPTQMSETRIEWEHLLQRGLDRIWQRLFSQEQLRPTLRRWLRTAAKMLTSQPLREWLPPPTQSSIAVQSQWLRQWLLQLAQRHGQALLASLHLPQVVEAQVNAMDIADVEEVLLQVMREQLRAITNLGFVLGALVGLLLPPLNAWLAKL